MSSSLFSRLASWLKKADDRGTAAADAATKEKGPTPPVETVKLTNPVENYYRHKVEQDVSVFYRFALQTRSLAIRDVFAKMSSPLAMDLQDLFATIQCATSLEKTQSARDLLVQCFDSEILLLLADLIVNTAREDWDTHDAVVIYDFVYQLFGYEAFSEQNKLQYVEAVHEVERYEQATRLAKAFNINELAPCQEDLLELQRIRRTDDMPREWLQALNHLYSELGMARVRFVEDSSVPFMDRLALETSEPVTGPKISVIVPTFSPGPGIRTAIRSLLEQSWQNLEIIVVDDASPAEYHNLFKEIKQLDPRISILRQKENAGAYTARNAGLAIATGEFITTHDDDDWSHPNKLEFQVNTMIADPEVVASTSAHIRTSEDLEFRRLNINAQFMQLNYSSLMFRNTVIDEIGHWDTVNRGGDSEFFTRLLEYYGQERVVNLLNRPLSFSRVWSGSLTSGEMSRGYFGYSRLLYRWAFRQWHWRSTKAGDKAVRKTDVGRPYAVPTTFEAGKWNADLGIFDVIYVTDYLRQAKYVSQALQEIETLSDAGLRVGYVHLYSPETTVATGVPPKLFELQTAGKVTQVSHDDAAETKLLVVNSPAIGMFLDQFTSTIQSHRSIVIDHKLPILSGGEPRTPTIHSVALRNLDNFFNTRFEITGSTEDDYERIKDLVPTRRMLARNFLWHTHIRSESAEILLPTDKLVVGFHSYGNIYRWPNNPEIFKDVHVSPYYETRLLGYVNQSIEKFGSVNFDQIEVFGPGDMDETTFLKGIDFWVYYPHYRLKDQVWSHVLSAMQAGKVVILPPRLEQIYGDAALYSEPEKVPEVVYRYGENSTAYREQAELGQRFVENRFTSEQYVNRVLKLMR